MDNLNIKSNSYILIQNFMVSDLGLKGNELLIYAIIYGFCQDQTSRFSGSLKYLATWTNSTKRGVMKNLTSLQEKGLIIKEEDTFNNLKVCKYSINFEVFKGMEQSSPVVNNETQSIEQSSPGVWNKVHQGIEQSSPNNIDNNIINNKKENIKRKKNSSKTSFEEEDLKNLVPAEYLPTFIKFFNERKSRKNPMSELAVKLAVKKLETSGLSIEEKIDCIENSIMNGYQGLFPKKQNIPKQSKAPIGQNSNFETKNTPLTAEQIQAINNKKINF